ncbi:hypothetical protein C7S14_6726 [Burkholderia cepacia]|nr:hypothetical protein C7S14_6726 [Burkholderia cepacia]
MSISKQTRSCECVSTAVARAHAAVAFAATGKTRIVPVSAKPTF